MRIFLMGYGVVGRSLVQLLEQRGDALYGECGFAPRLVGVADSRGAAVATRGLTLGELDAARAEHGTVGGLQGHGVRGQHPATLLDESNAEVVVEATPTNLANASGAMERLKAAFRHGMHAVSVNKAPLATALRGLLELARFNRVEFRFSGTVGAGTPVLELARTCARGDVIERARGILNGTTNYILWRMHEAGIDFDDALTEAQQKGYAETDPGGDIDGWDAAMKAVIFADWVMGRRVTIEDVSVIGIRGFDQKRLADAKSRGKAIKLVADIGDRIAVEPQEIEVDNALNVPAGLNAVQLTLRCGGDVTLIGRGAGGTETATGILRDLLDIWHTVEARR